MLDHALGAYNDDSEMKIDMGVKLGCVVVESSVNNVSNLEFIAQNPRPLDGSGVDVSGISPIARPRPANAGKVWITEGEDELLRLWIAMGPSAEIANRLGRSEFAIAQHFWKISGHLAIIVSHVLSERASRCGSAG